MFASASALPCYLFTYGSCMNQQSFTATLGCDSRRYFLSVATLHQHCLRFNYPSLNEPVCCANITPAIGHAVQGALYRMPAALLALVDRREGVHLHRYKRQWVSVLLPDGQQVMAMTYFARVIHGQEAAPSARYRQLLLDGAHDAGVTLDYKINLLQHMARLPAREMTDNALLP